MPNEDLLWERFELRWRNIEEKSSFKHLNLPNKEKLWSKVLEAYRKGFFCEYCGQQLLITDRQPPYYKSFSLDHRTSIDAGGNNSIENFAIICNRCNIIKGTMTEETYRALISPMLCNTELLDQVFKEMWNGRLANKLERNEPIKQAKAREEQELRLKNFLQTESDSTLPGCIGYHDFPIAPNGPCEKCRDKELCEETR